ncbi:hypothetical protein GCM10011521_00300 [Arenimonas soli]|uniref:Phage holin family protein n=1 Tax=Arenimonas soli TaxID=2269504 RepID=A0ABQ1H8Z7_9GAMM|nr:hypothetical protein [Arenimonas soli]GGA66135.1 hypothetical protein GCM10011521_00300 [Arenimonas soli]
MTDADPRAGEGAGKLGDDAHAVLSAASSTASAYVGTLRALRELFLAEVGLARHALTQAMVLLMLATVMVATTWGLLTALIVAGIRATGASWPLAIAVPLLLSVLIGAAAAWRAHGLMRHLDFEATRRQVKLGLKGLPSEPPSAGDDETTP